MYIFIPDSKHQHNLSDQKQLKTDKQ